MSDKVYRLFFWSQSNDPRAYVGQAAQADHQDLANVVGFLQNPRAAGQSQAGTAACRICGARLGSRDVQTGAFIWPEGTEHYILDHQVWTPDHQKLANTLKQRSKRTAAAADAARGGAPHSPAPEPAVEQAFGALHRALKAVQFLEHRLQTDPPPMEERVALTTRATRGLAGALDGLWSATTGGARLPPEYGALWTQGLGVMANLLLNELMPLVVGTQGEWQGKPFQGLLVMLGAMRSGRFVGLSPAAREEMAAQLHADWTDRLALHLADLAPFVTPTTPATVAHVDRATAERLPSAVPFDALPDRLRAYYGVQVDRVLAVGAGRMRPDAVQPMPPEAFVRVDADTMLHLDDGRQVPLPEEGAPDQEGWGSDSHRDGAVAAYHGAQAELSAAGEAVERRSSERPPLPFPGYDALAAKELIPKLRGLPNVASVEQALAYERAYKQRKGVLAVLEEVLGAAKLAEETMADDLRAGAGEEE